MAMEEMDAIPLDFSEEEEEEEEGSLPRLGRSATKLAAAISPDQVKSTLNLTPDSAESAKPEKRKRRSPKVPWKKPKDMPKRPLSAYNLFFQKERERLVKNGIGKKQGSNDRSQQSPTSIADPAMSSNATTAKDSTTPIDLNGEGKGREHVKSSGIGFANLAKTIAARWKEIDPEARAEFEAKAAIEKERYTKEMVVWRSKKKVEKQIDDKARSLDAELVRRSSTYDYEYDPRPILMRRLSDPYPDTSHRLDIYRHRQHMFNSSFTRACLAQMMQGSTLGMEPFLEPFNVPAFSNPTTIDSIDNELKRTFEEEPSDALRSFREEPSGSVRTFSDSFLDDNLYDVRPCEDIFTDVATRNEHIKEPPPPFAAQDSLRVLGSTLDDDTVDFITNMRFEA
jgi:hypothetical protein